MEPSQRPRRQNAGKAGADEGDVPDRSREEQGAADRRRLWIPVLHPELRIAPPYTEWTFFGDTVRMPEFCAPALGNKPNVVTIDAMIPVQRQWSTLQVGREFGGLTCYMEDGILCYEYNLFIIQRTKIRAAEKLPAGKTRIEIETRYVEPKPGGPLKVTDESGG